jgi:hypothetical protein
MCGWRVGSKGRHQYSGNNVAPCSMAPPTRHRRDLRNQLSSPRFVFFVDFQSKALADEYGSEVSRMPEKWAKSSYQAFRAPINILTAPTSSIEIHQSSFCAYCEQQINCQNLDPPPNSSEWNGVQYRWTAAKRYWQSWLPPRLLAIGANERRRLSHVELTSVLTGFRQRHSGADKQFLQHQNTQRSVQDFPPRYWQGLGKGGSLQVDCTALQTPGKL